jgi:ubiquinone/menaquinone biosynthesis C-methylase UbiE
MQLNKGEIEIGMIERFVDLDGKRILEVGCGSGRMTSLLAKRSAILVAIDPDETSIADARRNIDGVDFRVCSGESMEFEDGSFDLILFTMSLHHHANCALALLEAYRTLRETGRLVLLEPVDDSEIQRLYHLFADETSAIEKALDAIDVSHFDMEHYEIFDKDWVFENKEKLYDYHFENYGSADCDAGIIDRMNEQLGEKIDDRPVIVKDGIKLWVMRKKDKKKD